MEPFVAGTSTALAKSYEVSVINCANNACKARMYKLGNLHACSVKCKHVLLPEDTIPEVDRLYSVGGELKKSLSEKQKTLDQKEKALSETMAEVRTLKEELKTSQGELQTSRIKIRDLLKSIQDMRSKDQQHESPPPKIRNVPKKN